tara:strand:+ start:1869 stop:2321 length:453 start_codon:yes stop_codon:yes gene_type:complete
MPTKERITTPEVDTAEESVEEPVSAPISEPAAFNFKKYTLSLETEKRTLTIADTGETFEVTIKPISWAKRNQIISNSLKFGADGATGFDGDAYVRNCLKEVLVDAPWGRTTEAFLLTIDERLGTALERLVPKAFGEDDPEGVDIDSVKKE